MEGLTASFVDFKDALKALTDSQKDVTSLVMAWNSIMDTDTPGSVSIVLTNGVTTNVANLAKIREDLSAGLSLSHPTVTTITASSRNGSYTVTSSRSYGKIPKVEGLAIPGNSDTSAMGIHRNVCTDMRTVCTLSSKYVTLEMQELPEVVLLGTDTITDYNLTVNPPNTGFLNQNILLDGVQYITKVTFVNRKITDGQFMGSVKLTIGKFSRTILPGHSVSYFVWAAPGEGNAVNIHEYVPDLTVE